MTAIQPEQVLAGKAVLLSASIPDPERWDGEYDALEITDAVVAIGRAILSAGARLITAAHPTIAPLLLYIASELPVSVEPRVIVYQSAVFESIMPAETRRFFAEGTGIVISTERVSDEPPDPARAPESLALMRHQMLSEADAAVFVGGMAGIPAEMQLFNELRPGRPTYAIGKPGGEARRLAEAAAPAGQLAELLLTGNIYPTLGRLIVDDIAQPPAERPTRVVTARRVTTDLRHGDCRLVLADIAQPPAERPTRVVTATRGD